MWAPCEVDDDVSVMQEWSRALSPSWEQAEALEQLATGVSADASIKLALLGASAVRPRQQNAREADQADTVACSLAMRERCPFVVHGCMCVTACAPPTGDVVRAVGLLSTAVSLTAPPQSGISRSFNAPQKKVSVRCDWQVTDAESMSHHNVESLIHQPLFRGGTRQ